MEWKFQCDPMESHMSSDTCLSDLVFSATLTPDKKKKSEKIHKIFSAVMGWGELKVSQTLQCFSPVYLIRLTAALIYFQMLSLTMEPLSQENRLTY